MDNVLEKIVRHQNRLSECRLCPEMQPPVITCQPITSSVLLIGQAPGIHEKEHQRPFAWTAGKTLFKWFSTIDVDEATFRQAVYMSAICRCFPGKNLKGGDRRPNKQEITMCSQWLDAEIDLLKPDLILPVGKMAIEKFLSFKTLKEVIGKQHRCQFGQLEFDLIPLPHPSGASTWHVMEPGKSLLRESLQLIAAHPQWQRINRDLQV